MEQDNVISITVENTPNGWASVSTLGKGKQKISVTTQICGALDDRQLFSLRYCFIALDQLEELNQSQVSLSLHISTEQEDDAFRIQYYLAIMTVFREVILEITCGETKIEGLKQLPIDFYRIMPLLCVGNRKRPWEIPWEIHYLEMTNPGDISRTQALIHTSFQPNSSITPAYREKSAWDFINQALMNNLRKLQQDISGDSGGSMKTKDKQKLRTELRHVLEAEMPCLCLLAQLLWSLFLRSLSDSKDLFYRDGNHQWQINKETLHCSRLDAATYAEGILQLMENACIHSDMNRSYFTLRLRDVDITGSGVIRVAKASQTRVDIYKHYTQFWQSFSTQTKDTNQVKGTPNYQLDRKAKFCLEFSVLNDSTTSSGEVAGISQMFAKNRDKDKKEITLIQVFSYRCDRVSDISKHYGLRLLEKTIRLNGGFLRVSSPGTMGKQEWYGSYFSDEPKCIYRQDLLNDNACTELDGILPLYPHWHGISELPEESSPPSSLFKREEIGRKQYQQHIMRFEPKGLMNHRDDTHDPLIQTVDRMLEPDAVSPVNWDLTAWDGTGWTAGKDDLIKRIWQELKLAVKGHAEEDVYLLDSMKVWNILSVELLAKAIFLLVASERKEKRDNLRLALLLPNEMFISEFVRIFSIFYDKQLSNATWMGDTQIALCGYPPDGSRLPRVLLLLAGDTSGSARVTARTFAYYNPSAVLDLIPQIRYLTRTETARAFPQFPFDLTLTAVPESQTVSENRNWFLRQMQQELNANLWQRSHGCRIHGIRVRLHSNIYLSDFYEAELLFHNVGIIYRFAHLIAGHLLQQFSGDLPESLVVVGYEFYSSVLIEQITQLLSDVTTVHYLIYSTKRPDAYLHLSPQLKTMDEESRTEFLKSAKYVAVVPIGTTMSTLYQIVQEIEAQWQGSFPYINYVLILVGQEGEGTLSSKYWSKELNDQGYLCLQPQRNRDQNNKWENADNLKCRYYLEPQTNWAQGTPDQGTEEEVLVYVDKTSTRPKEIFVVEDSRFRGTSYFLREPKAPTENDRRLELLKGLIHYGHIAEGNNHFQFYLDMDQYFSRAQQKDRSGGRKTVDQWLQGLRTKVDPNAYNIIVSPLHQEDSPFAKAVIDQVFEHSLRFLHIDLAESFREDVRAKFSYISDEYRKIKQFDRNKPVNIYFINTAITSGSTLMRARNLMTMLMEESGMEYSRENIFKGCFVLVNRSGFDTVNSYISNPGECFFAYLHLAVPSFNIRRDHCPTCELLDQYRTLEFSSAGNSLGQEFRRLRVKHAKRTVEEHQNWLEDAAMNSAGYAGWLCQWLYSYIRIRHSKNGKLWAGIFEIDEEEYSDLKALYNLLKWGMKTYSDSTTLEENDLNAINTFSLRQLEEIIAAHSEQASKIVGKNHLRCLQRDYWTMVLTDYVCAQKSYLRLVSTHRTFLKMDTIVRELEGDIPRRGEQTAGALAKLMESEIRKADNYHLKAEWLISYLKVISRPHLAQYHHIRQGILTLMLHMTAYAIGATDELRSDLDFAKPFLRPDRKERALICCQVLQTLLKRLAGLQSTYFLRDKTIEKVLATFSQLRRSFYDQYKRKQEYQQFNPFPTQE